MSIISLGSYAVRKYSNWFHENQFLVKDLLDHSLASLIPPMQSNILEWKSKEFVKLQALFTISSIDNSLALYWKGFCILLSSSIPCLDPSRSSISSLLLNTTRQLQRNEVPSSSLMVSRKVMLSALGIIIQFTDGGTELSNINSLFRKKDKKRKKQQVEENSEQEELVNHVTPNETTNALIKLDSLCEVSLPPTLPPSFLIFVTLIVVMASIKTSTR